MLRFSAVMHEGLVRRGLTVKLVRPPVVFGKLSAQIHTGAGKWLGYLDKFLLFPLLLRLRYLGRRLFRPGANRRLVTHICDHSNAPYSSHVGPYRPVISCHDLLAVRGALGEETDCPASPTGKILQKWILHGLGGASIIGCISTATKRDVERLVRPRGPLEVRLILMGQNHAYRCLTAEELETRLPPEVKDRPYLLHVGSNLPRKNRGGVLRMFAKAATEWPGTLVFAGQALTPELREQARSLGVADRVIEIVKPSSQTLEALYNRAFAMLFPSRFEGFGWPIIEAQACGCPVLCGDSGPLPEVAGDAALMHPVEDEDGFAASILSLRDPAVREGLVQRGLANIGRFTTDRMVDEFVSAYQASLAQRS